MTVQKKKKKYSVPILFYDLLLLQVLVFNCE